MNNNLRIDNPCPTLLNRMTKEGDNYSCKTCKKTVIDFRNKNIDDIKNSITKDTCGIFTKSQLPGQKKMSNYRQSIFLFMTVLSFLGFNVSPSNAQKLPPNEKMNIESTVKKKHNQTDSYYDSKEHQRKFRLKNVFRRKKRITKGTIGCPSF